MMDIKELIESADDAHYATDYDNAIGLYKQVLDIDPDNKHVQQQIRKAELNRPSKIIKPINLPTEALQLYKRSRSFIAIGDLAGAMELLKQAVEIAEKTGVDFPEAQALLGNIQNAYKADVFKKKAIEELDSQEWVRAEANLNFALDFDPTDDVVQTLLAHLRSLLKAQNLAHQLNSGIGTERNRSKADKEIQKIIERTNDTFALKNLWLQVLEARYQKTTRSQDVETKVLPENPFEKKGQIDEMKPHTARIFVSYSHKDEFFKDEFMTMFAGLQRQGLIDAWHDRRIVVGEEWFDAIQKAIENCDLAVLLVSPDFIASSFIQTKELTRLFQRRIAGGLSVVPVIIRQCLWQGEPVIKDLLAFPKDGKPVISFSKDNGDRDQVWADICKAIEMVAAGL